MTKLFVSSLVTLFIFFMAVFIDAACKSSTKQEAPPPPAQFAPTPTPPTPITPPVKETTDPPTVEKKEEAPSPLKDLGYGPKPAPDAGTSVKKPLPLKPIPDALKK